jgi:hypothetical protein
MPTLEVYSRHGCHLCEQLIEELLPLVRGHFDIDVRDIDSREDWQRAYDVRVPVVEFGGRLICEYHLDRAAIRGLVAEQASREQ